MAKLKALGGNKKPRGKHSLEHKSLFDSLVSNAINFLTFSIRDFKTRPKYSIIHFCSGLEIFLKARLLQEHWSLILKKPDEASFTQFQKGTFNSATMDETIRRLQNVVGDIFTGEELQCFQKVRDHRNKVVHFYHTAYTKKASDKLLEEIAAEQCKAWFYLHGRITGPWRQRFLQYQARIGKLNNRLHGHRIFLKAKYTALKSEISKKLAAGVEVINCSSCGFNSYEAAEIGGPFYEGQCLVCTARRSFLRISCPKCNEESDIDDLTNASCDNEDCESVITLDDVLKKYTPPYDPRDGDESPLSYCASCEHPEESVIPLNDEYVCCMCRKWYENVEECNWCGMTIAGFDPQFSALYGCFLCEEAAREHFDRM
ncbi:MAG: hypothetical protein H8K07_20335 [Nitrospira sp.]|nr:hypothetical protein [Nitrospira sp.]